MEFIQDLIIQDTYNILNDICDKLKLDESQRMIVYDKYLKKNYFNCKEVSNGYLYLSSNNKSRVCMDNLISKVDCASNQ